MKKYLIVGLGNIGLNYVRTRHNIGFDIINQIATEHKSNFSNQKYGEVAELNIKGKRIYLLKPSTFMNLSGKSIKYYLNYFNIPLINLLVVSDDLNLDFGKIRLRKKGSDGGHNGHKNIIEVLKTSNYCRLRFGIGQNFQKGEQVKYVLSKWSPSEEKNMTQQLDFCSKTILNFVFSGIEDTMNNFNN